MADSDQFDVYEHGIVVPDGGSAPQGLARLATTRLPNYSGYALSLVDRDGSSLNHRAVHCGDVPGPHAVKDYYEESDLRFFLSNPLQAPCTNLAPSANPRNYSPLNSILAANVSLMCCEGSQQTTSNESWFGMTETKADAIDAPQIIVEFPPQTGTKKVARSPEDLAKASAEALDRAMDTIRAMAERTKKAIESLDAKPDDIEITFGIKLTAEAGAIIAKVGGEAALEVKLAWKLSPAR
ncbi:hypothetical protein BH09ACT7_BH09ACT7_29000 [soil metagenome]